jgi:hypothetical protein
MTFTRRVSGGKKRRKEIFRYIKKLCKKVIKHGKTYRELLPEMYEFKTDLSKAQVDVFVKRLDNILNQSAEAIRIANSRIISEKKVGHKEKIFSLYDDNASLIVRGKSGAEVEFGNELLVSEQEDGLITAWKLYKAKTSDTKKFNDIFDDMTSNGYHMEALVTDRGFYGKNNSKKLVDNNIYDCILPKNRTLHAERLKDEKFRKLQKRRSQTESLIATIKNYTGNKLKSTDFEYKKMFVGWAIITHNLVVCSKLKRKKEVDEIKIAS